MKKLFALGLLASLALPIAAQADPGHGRGYERDYDSDEYGWRGNRHQDRDWREEHGRFGWNRHDRNDRYDRYDRRNNVRWIREGRNALLIDVRYGRVLRVIRGYYW